MSGGPLKFEAVIETVNFDDGVKSMEQKLNDFTNAGESNTQKVDQAMEKLGATIKKVPSNIQDATKALAEQKNIIATIERDIVRTQKELDKAAPGRVKNDLQLELNATKKALEEEKVILKEVEAQADQAGESKIRLRTQIMNLREEMARMESQGKRNTDEYRNLRNETAALQDAMNDTRKQTNILANEQQGFQGVISGVSGMTGAFAAAQGAMGLFNVNNEKMMKIQTRVQSLMAITIGLQQVSNVLNKDSAFRIVTVNQITGLWARSQAFLNTQLGISVGLSRALMTFGIGAIIAGIGFLIQRLSQWNAAQKQNNELQKQAQEVITKTAGAMAKEKAEMETLKNVLENTNAGYQERYDALQKLREIVPSYNASLTKEGELINNNTDALDRYIETFKSSLFIKVNQEQFEELFREQFELDAKIKEASDRLENEVSRYNEVVERFAPIKKEDPTAFSFDVIGAAKAKEKTEKELSGFEKQRSGLLKRIEAQNSAFAEGLAANKTEIELNMMGFDQLLVEWLQKGNDAALEEARRRLTTENSIKAYIQSLEKARGDLNTESMEYKRVVAEIEGLKKLEEIKIVPDLKDETKTFAQQLRDIREEYETFYQWAKYLGEDVAQDQFATLIENGDNFLQYLTRQITELEKKKQDQGLTKDENNQLVELRSTQDNIRGTKSDIEQFKDEIEQKKDGYRDLGEYIVYLESQIQSLSQAESEFNFAKTGVLTKELEDARTQQQNIFRQILADTQSFEQRIFGIRQDYAEKRRVLSEMSSDMPNEEYQKRLDLVLKMEDDEIASENRVYTERSDLMQKIYQKTQEHNRRELKERIEIIRQIITAEKAKIQALGLTNEMLDELEKELEKANLQLSELTTQSFVQVAAGLRSVAQAATSINDELAVALQKMADIAEAAIDVGVGVAKIAASGGTDIGAWAQAISGYIRYIGNLIGLIKDDSAKRVLLEIEEFNRRAMLGEIEINQLYRERLRTQLQINSAQLQGLKDLQAELKKQSSQISMDLKGLFDEIMDEQYLADVSKQKRSFFKRLFGDNYELKEEWQSLVGKSYEDLEQLFYDGKLSERAEELFRKMQELRAEGYNVEMQLAEMQKQMESIFTATTAQSIAQSIADGFASGKRSMADFADDFEEMMRKAIISGFASRYIQPALEEFYATFAAFAQSSGRRGTDGEFGNLTEDEISALRDKYGSLIDQLGEQFNIMQQIAGVDFDSTNKGLSGAIKGVTEETAGKLEGYINAIRITQAQQVRIITQQLSTLLEIAANTSYNRYLVDIHTILKKQDSSKPLRAKGFA